MFKLRVAYSRFVWLQQTELWLYNQLKYLDHTIEAYVICREVANLDQFSVKNTRKLQAPSQLERHYEKLLKKLGIHTYHRPLVRELMRVKPSILHSHFGHAAWVEMPAAKKLDLRHMVTFYGYDVSRLPVVEPVWRERYEELFDHIHLVLCEGSFMGGKIRDLGCPANKIRVHHLGIEVDKIPFRPRKWEQGQTLRVLIAATFREKKGIPYAVEALKDVADMIPLEVTIVGDADPEMRSQKEKERILNTIGKSGLEDRVRMLGYQTHGALLDEAYEHHIFISPSVTAGDGDSEGGAPMTLIEMAATGMPVVSTKHCDIPEVFEGGKTGLLAEERDVAGLVAKLRWLIENRDKWGTLVDSSRRHIEHCYNARMQGMRLSEIYREVHKE